MTPRASRATAPVFVVGSPRSGTTLLYHQLLSAGGFAVYRAEASVFNLLGPRFGDLSVARHRMALLDAWLPSEYFRRSGLDPDSFRASVQERCRSTGDFLRLFMEAIAGRQGVHRWAECTPENLLYVRAIKRSIPEALFLHIVRDGRDVACSLAEQGWVTLPVPRGERSRLVQSGLYWAWMVERGRRDLRGYPADTLEVRFESLVRDPEQTLARVGAFIAHDLDYARIRRCGIGTVSRPNTSFPADGPVRAFEPIGRWRHGAGAGELARLEAAIGPALEMLGYPVESDAASRREAAPAVEATRRLTFGYFSSRHWLKTRTPLGQVFTNPAQLRDFHAFDRRRPAAPSGRVPGA